MKKVFSFFIVLTVIFSLCIVSFAADVTVNVNGGLTDHTFAGYKILSGDYDSVNQNLSNVIAMCSNVRKILSFSLLILFSFVTI